MTVSRILLALAAIALNAVGASATPAATSECYANTQVARVLELNALAVDSSGLDSCTLRHNVGFQALLNNHYRKAYDTLRSFVQSCPNHDYAARSFSEIGKAWAECLADSTLFDGFRQWLLDVLYLSDSSDYYCSDLMQIPGTFAYNPAIRGRDVNASLAVLKFIKDSTLCGPYADEVSQDWSIGRSLQYQHWRDTVTVDTNIYKMDTTLPSIDDLGLSSIRRGTRGVPKEPMHRLFALKVLSVSTTELLSEITLSYSGSVTFEMLNILGERIKPAEQAHYEAGTSRVLLRLTDVPAGAYFLRASTLEREVQTVKIVKR
jgi:hypothetical protein